MLKHEDGGKALIYMYTIWNDQFFVLVQYLDSTLASHFAITPTVYYIDGMVTSQQLLTTCFVGWGKHYFTSS